MLNNQKIVFLLNKRIFFLFFLFFFMGCGPSKPDYIKMADALTGEYLKEIQSEYGFFVRALGGSMRGSVKKVIISFNTLKEIKLEEARIIAIELGERLIKKINDNGEIRPYLQNYPFNKNNIDITLSFNEEAGPRVKREYITVLFIGGKNIRYLHYDHHKKEFCDELEEFYEYSKYCANSDPSKKQAVLEDFRHPQSQKQKEIQKIASEYQPQPRGLFNQLISFVSNKMHGIFNH